MKEKVNEVADYEVGFPSPFSYYAGNKNAGVRVPLKVDGSMTARDGTAHLRPTT